MSLSTTINYVNPANFTFDATLAQVASNVASLKDITPLNATFYAGFQENFDASYGLGTLGCFANGSPTIVNNQANLSGAVNQYLLYNANNFASVLVGTIRYKYIPTYSGAPSQDQYHFFWGDPTSDNNAMYLVHQNSNNLVFQCTNNAGTLIINVDLGSWNPTVGTIYEIEIDFDLTGGANRVFINGAQFGATNTSTGTRTGSVTAIKFGQYRNVISTTAQFKLQDIQLFSTVQHTSNFTGEIPRAPATRFSTANPSVTVNNAINMKGLVGFSAVETLLTDDGAVQFQLIRGSTPYWWNGSAWVVSDGTYAQSNTQFDINANAAAFDLSAGYNIKVAALLHTPFGDETPQLQSVTVTYDFHVAPPTEPATVVCFAFVQNILGLVPATATLFAAIAQGFIDGGIIIVPQIKSVSIGSDGYVEIDIFSTVAANVNVTFTIEFIDLDGNLKTLRFKPVQIPNQVSVDLSTLLSVA